MKKTGYGCAAVIVISGLLAGAEREASSDHAKSGLAPHGPTRAHEERPRDPWKPRPVVPPPGVVSRSAPVVRGPYTSIQVNIDEFGNNIPGDAANEPSIAIDPTNPNKIVIGWRQFDSVESDFRQAGWGYSHDGGETWTFPGVLEPGVFRSDPVLDADADGNIYFYSLTDDFRCDLFKSVDGGVSWLTPVPAFGGDKPWMAIDRTDGIGRSNIYATWSTAFGFWCDVGFTRSTDGGATFMDPTGFLGKWGTMSVGADGTLFAAGWCSFPARFLVRRSINAQDGNVTPVFETSVPVYLGGSLRDIADCYPNPRGLCGQVWVATDHSDGPTRGNVYLLASVATPSLEVMFARSTNGGLTWSDAVRVNDHRPGSQWFGTMSVAPNGRIDVVWNDGRNAAGPHLYELFYAYSMDGGRTWSENISVSPMFDSWVGWPQQNKLGDYYDMISDNGGANVAYAATFNGEQDVYFLRIPFDCNDNGIEDPVDIAGGTSNDCNNNDIADECESDEDCNGNEVQDFCDLANGTSDDCDGNRIPDECGPQEDCNDNDVQDICDIAEGTSHDWNENRVPDDCEQWRLFVDAQASGSNDGISWTNAYVHLQNALAAADASNGVIREIWVAAGTYTPDQGANQTPGDRTATFQLLSDVAIYGGFAGGEMSLEQRSPGVNMTVLSGDLNGDDPDSNCCLMHPVPGCDDTECETAVCEVDDWCCEFPWDSNCAFEAASICGFCPGDNRENSNHVVTGSGTGPTAILDGFTVSAGFTFGEGAGMYVGSFAAPRVSNCAFIRNVAWSIGGGVFSSDSAPHLTNCVFIGNSADYGGAIYARGSLAPMLTNCTLTGNSALNFGGVWGSGTTLTDCILWGNTDEYNEGERAQIDGGTINYSCVQGWTGELGGTGNIGDDPLFVDTDGLDGIPGTIDDDLRFVPASPCIDTGDPEFAPESDEADLDGHARVLCGRIDMGAYEFGIGDFDCNRNNDLIDFANWSECMTGPAGGPYTESCEAFDFDFDGDVDVKDFHGFQTAYGPCPDPTNDDIDGDGICRNIDNCPNDVNIGQKDTDGDGVGDVCDTCTDTDGDGFGDPGFPVNTCPDDTCPGFDDNDDADGDGNPDACDPCPTPDTDDADGDAICDNVDNCPDHSNPDQADCNLDGAGNVCEIAECPGDAPACSDCNDNGVPDECELFPVGYENSNHAGDGFSPGIEVYFADDITLGVPECNLVAYEIAFKGTIIGVGLRTHLDPDDPAAGGVIPGTGAFFFPTGEDVDIGRVEVDPPYRMVANTTYWAAFRSASSTNGPIATCQQASVGSTDDSYAFHDGKAWVFADIGDLCHSGFDLRIECASLPDCNGNSVPDECDIADGSAADCNGNLILDECELAGNFNCDNDVDLVDYGEFIACVTVPGENIEEGCEPGDVDRDGDVDLGDFAALQASFTGSLGP